jgi:hypothetical protein
LEQLLAAAGEDWLPLYNHIETWWDRELNVELADTISGAPDYQIVAFSESFAEQDVPFPDRMTETETIPAGSLRPMVALPGLGRLTPPVDNVPMALRLLLYVQEVVLEIDFLHILFHFAAVADVTTESRSELRRTLLALAAIRPLVLRGVIHVTHVLSRARHPSQSGRAREAAENPEMMELARQLAGIPSGVEVSPWELTEVLLEHFGVLYFACSLATRHLATPLALSETDSRVLSAALSRQIQDGRFATVSHLARLPVPEFESDAELLVRLRNDEACFGEWRQKLSGALTAIDSLPDSADMNEAADIIRSELESATARINRSVSRSPALTAAKGGWRRIGVGAIGAATTGLITGNPYVALAGLGASQLADTALAYLSELSQRRSDRLILDVIASFTPET